MVRPGEAAIALRAAERLDARVFAEMSREFVRPRESPRAALPGAVVRLLPCVDAAVGFEVGALGVDLFAAFVVTHVYSSAPHLRRVGVNLLQVDHRTGVDALADGHWTGLRDALYIAITVDLWRRGAGLYTN